MKKIILFFSFLMFFSSSSLAAFQSVTGIDSSDIKDVAFSPFYPNIVYVASRNSLYKSENSGQSFEKVESFIGEEIRQIFFNKKEVGILYLVTSRRLYQITDDKERLFTLDDDENILLCAANHDGELYVGTTEGLYASGQDYLRWVKVEGLSGRQVRWIEPYGQVIYLAVSDGVYILDEKKSLRRTFVLRKTEGEEVPGLLPHQIKTDRFFEEKIWLATSKGLFVSEDSGNSFRKFFASGIDNLSIFSLAQTGLEKRSLYLATERGFFRLDLKSGQVRGLFAGLYASEVRGAEFSKKGKIYLATDKGLFTNQYFTLARAKNENLEQILNRQPSIRYVHEKAMDFNEVSPEKIAEWRRKASLKPLFPQMRLGYDKTMGYRGGATYERVGPRDWGVTFTWNIGDLVWNPSQTSIDTRSRLNTQLRLDILEGVNRVYYERLRLIKRLASDSLSREDKPRKELRLKELTAMLDYYTGGAFSQRLKKLKKK